MKRIKNVVICGLGAIGGFYAAKISEDADICLKVLVDESRLKKYANEPRIINNKKMTFDYVLPYGSDFKADLIIISTKSNGLDEAIKNINNFVKNDTIIISFLNGITSENLIKEVYGEANVIRSFLIGHTFFRNGKHIEHDGNAKIVFGTVTESEEIILILKNFFDEIGVKYEVSENILTSQWEKYCFNCCANQISAITRMTFGQMKSSAKCLELMRNITGEISTIAKCIEIEGASEFYNTTLDFLELMLPEGKTSMLQDIEAGLKPEIDIFGKTVVELGEKYNVPTPYNKVITEIIESISVACD